MNKNILFAVKADGLFIEVPPFENISIIEKLLEFAKQELRPKSIDDQNVIAFESFLKENIDNVQYHDKYVAFVNGNLQGVDDKRVNLIKLMYERFGNVKMIVEKVTEKQEVLEL